MTNKRSFYRAALTTFPMVAALLGCIAFIGCPEATKTVDDVIQPPLGMVLIPAGEFLMGSNSGNDDEKPVHTVSIDAFYMDKYEVTNAQYKRFVDANPEWAEVTYSGFASRLVTT